MSEGGRETDEQIGDPQIGVRQRDTDRDHLYSLRETHLGALNMLFEEIEDEERRVVLGRNQLRVRKERLHHHFKGMERAHVLYLQVCLIASNDIYVATERRYMEVVAKIDDRMDEISRTELAQLNQSGFQRGEASAISSIFPAGQQVIRVETARPPQVGTFNGDPADWPAFRDLFLAEVHSKDLEPVNKLLLLQAACIDKAAATLGPWQPTGDNYLLAWDVLMSAYDDEYLVVHGIMGKLFAIPRQDRENFGSLTVIYQTLTNGLRQLRTIRPGSDVIFDQMCIHLAKQRLPKETLDSWEQRRNEKKGGELPSCEEFLKFLCIKAKGRREFEYDANSRDQSSSDEQEADASSQRFKPYDRNHHRDKSYQRSRFETTKAELSMSCIVQGCDQTHRIWQCESFTKLSLTQRKELTRKYRLCRCCLSPGHLSFACPRAGCPNCPEANFKHHVKLCPKSTDNEDTKPNVTVMKQEVESSEE